MHFCGGLQLVRIIWKEEGVVIAHVSVAAFAFNVGAHANLNFTSIVRTAAYEVVAYACTL